MERYGVYNDASLSHDRVLKYTSEHSQCPNIQKKRMMTDHGVLVLWSVLLYELHLILISMTSA